MTAVPPPEVHGWTLRRASGADLSALLELEYSVFGKDAYDRAKMAGLLECPQDNTLVLVAPAHEPLVGYGVARIGPLQDFVRDPERRLSGHAFMPKMTEPVGYLQSMAVRDDPSARRRGAGTALVRARLDWIKRRGVSHVVVFAWPRGHGLQLLRNLDFAVISAWPEKQYADGSTATLCYRRLEDQRGADCERR
jgi:ribosomal protein S18 acetylase RimI-like enzyme